MTKNLQSLCDLMNEISALIEENKKLKAAAEELKKENAELKNRWQCKNKHMCLKGREEKQAVPCYEYHGCFNCSLREGEQNDE